MHGVVAEGSREIHSGGGGGHKLAATKGQLGRVGRKRKLKYIA